MSRIFITGDIHGDGNIDKLSFECWPESKDLTKDDYLIICGDFGLVWDDPQSKQEVYWLNWLTKIKPWTTLFVDGNHENHVKLNSYPVEEWRGGKVHKITDSVIHLMRGQIFNINDCKWFTYGGAESIDKEWRTPYKSWWPQETPSLEDYNEAIRNLQTVDFKVDYVVTHAMPEDYVERYFPYRRGMNGNTTPFQLYDFKKIIEYKHWYCGHYHKDADINNSFHMLYNDIIEVKFS